MANTIRTALVIDLEGNVVGEIRKIDKALDESGSGAEKTGARFKQFFNSLSDGLRTASASLKRMGSELKEIGQNLSLKVTAPITAMGAGILKTAGDFEAGMNRVAAVSGASGEEFAALAEQARELGRTTKFSASEAAEAMGFLAMAGNDATEIMKAMPATLQLAAASGVDLASAADTVTNILAGFRLETDELARANDVLVSAMTGSNTDLVQLGEALKYAGPVASSFGLTLEETTAALGMMGNAGIQASMAGTSLRGMLTRLVNPSKEAAEILSDLGISAMNADGSMRPLADILGQIERSGMDSAEAMEVFGQRAGPAVLALVGQGTQALTDLQTRLEGAGGTAERISKVQMQGLNGAMKSLSSAVEGLGLAIASSGLLEFATGLVTKFTEWVRVLAETNPEILNLGVVVAGAAAAIGPIALILGGVVTALGALLSPIGLVVAAVGGLAAAWIAFGDDIKAMASQAVEYVTDMVAAIKRELVDRFTSIVDGVGEKIDAVTGFFADMWDKVVGHSYVPDMVDGIQREFGRLPDVMVDPAEEATSTVAGFFEDLGRKIGSTIRSILDGTTSLKDGLKSLVSDIGSMIQDRVVDAAVDGLLGLLPGGVQNFFGVGKGGSGIGRHISGGGIGGSIGEGTGLGGLGKTIATSIKGGFRSVGTALKGIFGGGSSATAAGNLGFKGPAAFATPAAGGSSSFLGMTGMAIPAAILGGTLIGTSVLESRDRKKAKRFYNREFAPNFDPSGVEELANGTFLTALEDVHGELDSIYVAIDTQVMTALEDAGVAAMALNMGFEAGGKEVRRIVGDVDAVRTALDNAKVKGYEFGGSLETAIEKGNGLKVAIEGDSEAIKNALQQATAAGIGGFSNLEVTASGVSATLTGDIAQWRKYLDDVLSAALSVAGGFRDVGSEASGAVSDVMALAKAIASMPSITGTSSGSGDRGGYAYGGISRGPQLAWVSEGPYPVEAHIPMLDGRTIPVRFANQAPAAPAGIDIGPLVTEIRGVRQDLDRVVGRPITRTLGRVQRRAAATARKR